jgi:hypothetical protein
MPTRNQIVEAHTIAAPGDSFESLRWSIGRAFRSQISSHPVMRARAASNVRSPIASLPSYGT